MKSRMAKILILAAIALPLSGCPSVSIELGLWFLWVKFDGELGNFHSIVLLPGGETEPPDPPVDGTLTFDGTVTWSQFGSRLTLVQEVDASTTYRLRGDIETPRKVRDGILSQVGGGATGQWFADKDLIGT